MTLQEMIEKDLPDSKIHKGFRVVKGKIVYWYFNSNKFNGSYRCWELDELGYLVSDRYIRSDAQVILVEKEKSSDNRKILS